MSLYGNEFNISESGTGRPFVWGHGLMSSMAAEGNRLLRFDKLALSNRVVRYDARGHGLSEVSSDPEDYQWDSLANDMLNIASMLNVQRFVAGGASMGCATSLYAALQAPERVEGLVLVIPPTAWETRMAQVNLYDDMASFIETHTPENLPAMAAATPEHWSALSTVDERVDTLSNMYEALPTILHGAKLSNLPDRDVLEELQMPALILCWTDDPGHPVSTAMELHRLLPNSRLATASNLGELSTWTQLVQDFLRELPHLAK